MLKQFIPVFNISINKGNGHIFLIKVGIAAFTQKLCSGATLWELRLTWGI